MRGAKRARAQVAAKSGKRPVPYALCRRCQQDWKRQDAVRCTLRQCSEAMDILAQMIEQKRELLKIADRICGAMVTGDDVTQVVHHVLACGRMWLKRYPREKEPVSFKEWAEIIQLDRARLAGDSRPRGPRS